MTTPVPEPKPLPAIPRASTRAIVLLELFLVPLLAVVGCAAGPAGPVMTPTETPPLDLPYEDLSCETAFRYALRAMRTRGYEISAVERSGAGGSLTGTNQNVSGHRLTISCGSDGVRIGAEGGGLWADQGLKMSFKGVAERGDRLWPPPTGPRAIVEEVRGPESKVYFPVEIGSLGMTAVRVRFVNGGDRPLRLVPSRMKAQGKGGARLGPIAGKDAASKLGSTQVDILETTRVAPGEEVVGFLFFPAGDYERLTIVMIDEPTGEADELDISL